MAEDGLADVEGIEEEGCRVGVGMVGDGGGGEGWRDVGALAGSDSGAGGWRDVVEGVGRSGRHCGSSDIADDSDEMSRDWFHLGQWHE